MVEVISGTEFHNIRRYENYDLAEINQWYDLRHCPKVEQNALPSIGFITPGVAAGFLYQTDSALCLLDGYVSNPTAYKIDRDIALDVITSALLAEAKRMGFSKCLSFTLVEAIAMRARRHGFKVEGPQTLLSRGIA